MRGSDGVMVRGKFTPIRSGHLPPIPQQQNTLLQTPGQYSAPPVELEARRAVRTLQSADMVMEESRRTWKRERREKRWRKVYRVIDFVLCCGLCEIGKPKARGLGDLDGVAESPRQRTHFVGPRRIRELGRELGL